MSVDHRLQRLERSLTPDDGEPLIRVCSASDGHACDNPDAYHFTIRIDRAEREELADDPPEAS